MNTRIFNNNDIITYSDPKLKGFTICNLYFTVTNKNPNEFIVYEYSYPTESDTPNYIYIFENYYQNGHNRLLLKEILNGNFSITFDVGYTKNSIIIHFSDTNGYQVNFSKIDIMNSIINLTETSLILGTSDLIFDTYHEDRGYYIKKIDKKKYEIRFLYPSHNKNNIYIIKLYIEVDIQPCKYDIICNKVTVLDSNLGKSSDLNNEERELNFTTLRGNDLFLRLHIDMGSI